jgi:hypothetical protein
MLAFSNAAFCVPVILTSAWQDSTAWQHTRGCVLATIRRVVSCLKPPPWETTFTRTWLGRPAPGPGSVMSSLYHRQHARRSSQNCTIGKAAAAAIVYAILDHYVLLYNYYDAIRTYYYYVHIVNSGKRDFFFWQQQQQHLY